MKRKYRIVLFHENNDKWTHVTLVFQFCSDFDNANFVCLTVVRNIYQKNRFSNVYLFRIWALKTFCVKRWWYFAYMWKVGNQANLFNWLRGSKRACTYVHIKDANNSVFYNKYMINYFINQCNRICNFSKYSVIFPFAKCIQYSTSLAWEEN